MKDAVNGLLDHLRAEVSKEEWPDYLFICPDALEGVLSSETLTAIEAQLERSGIELISASDLDANGALPREGVTSSNLCVLPVWRGVFIGGVEVADGHGGPFVSYSYREEEVRLYVLGGWFAVKRKEGGTVL